MPFQLFLDERLPLGRTPSYAEHRTVAKGRQGERVFPLPVEGVCPSELTFKSNVITVIT